MKIKKHIVASGVLLMVMTTIYGATERQVATGKDTLRLTLRDAVELAQRQSPSVQSARNAYLAAKWNYRYHLANYLPSVTLSSSNYINKVVNKITQSDGTALFLKQNQQGNDLTLKITQNIPMTGGSLFLKSGISRLHEGEMNTTEYSAEPLVVGYEQSLFGYNSLKWDKRIEPVRFREARKRYAEAIELVAANTCSRFFTLASAQMELEMARQNYAAADTLYRMAQGRYAIGTITENEMLQLEINRLNEETNVMDADIALREETLAMRSFLGIDNDMEIALTLPDSVPQFEVPIDIAMSKAMEKSPDPEYYNRIMQESKSNLAVARANAGLRADIYMQFGLSQTGPNISDSYRSPMQQEYANITLSLPILDWGRGKGRIRVAKSQLALTNTQVEQGMSDFRQNVARIVAQFNMQVRRVKMSRLTDQRATQRHAVAQRLYVMGRNSILDLNAAVSEKNAARRNCISAQQTYWTLYHTLRSITGYDFENNTELWISE